MVSPMEAFNIQKYTHLLLTIQIEKSIPIIIYHCEQYYIKFLPSVATQYSDIASRDMSTFPVQYHSNGRHLHLTLEVFRQRM